MAEAFVEDVAAYEFRPVQYLGNKWRLLDDIESAVAQVARPERPRVLDLFAGSGVVAARLASSHPVLAVDVQEYSRVLTSALLTPEPPSTSTVLECARAEYKALLTPAVAALEAYEESMLAECVIPKLAEIIERGSMAAGGWREAGDQFRELVRQADDSIAATAVMTRYYGGVYFSYGQALRLDALARAAHRMEPPFRDTAIAALLGTASDLVASVGGHFAQPLRPRDGAGRLKRKFADTVHRARTVDPFVSYATWLQRYTARSSVATLRSEALRADYRDVVDDLPADVGCVYADPPYTRDHYSRFYHVLETLAVGDDPGISTRIAGGKPIASRGLYRADRHQSPFCVVSKAPAAFEAMFAPLAKRRVSLVLSYSPVPETEKPRARVMALDSLIALVRAHFSRVFVQTPRPLAHAKLNAERLNAAKTYDAEVLIVARP